MSRHGYLTLLLLLLSLCGCAAQRMSVASLGPYGSGAGHLEVLSFLAEAQVISTTPFQDGINQNWRLEMGHGRRRAAAILRRAHDVEPKPFVALGGRKFYFRDSYLGEIAAYEVNRMLGMYNVPPTVRRQIDGQPGTVQLWLESTETLYKLSSRNAVPPHPGRWNLQQVDMRVFDSLINNVDRHPKNQLIDTEGNLWLIDHTQAFGRDEVLPPSVVLSGCSPKLLQHLQRLSEQQVHERLGEYLSPGEIQALLVRRQRLLVELQAPVQ